MFKITISRSLSTSLAARGGWKAKIPGYRTWMDQSPHEQAKPWAVPYAPGQHMKVVTGNYTPNLGDHGRMGAPTGAIKFDNEQSGEQWHPWMTRIGAMSYLNQDVNKEWRDQAILEYEKWGHKFSHGFDNANPGRDDWMEKKYNWIIMWLTVIMPLWILWWPQALGQDEMWFKEEAIIRIEERVAKGLPILDPNFCPLDVIDKHVPPPGEWEEEYLSQQPSTYPVVHRHNVFVMGQAGQFNLH